MAVIVKTVSVIRQMQGIILLSVLYGVGVANSNPTGCENVGKELQTRGLPIYSTLLRPETGPICDVNSCCGRDLENNLKQFNRMYLDHYVRDSISKVSSLIETRARKFDEFFKEMMVNSKREFHDMFERTYGKIYLQNSDVFSDFFGELEVYYKKGSVRLSETMDNFFGILYQRMFTVINSQYVFDDKYLECVSDHMSDMKPFGDIPHKLGVQLRRSFVATRTFYKSLVQGAQIAHNLGEIMVDEECAIEITRMQQCGICTGQQSFGACADYCTNTLENCLKYHTSFGKDWDKFIDGLDKVADRLLGPFNIEGVVEPLNIKISEAIMIFQENGSDVSKKIYSLCGQPTLSRRRRKTESEAPVAEDPNYEIKSSSLKPSAGKRKHKKTEKVDNTPTLKKLILDIKTKIRDTRQFWVHLPYQYCNNDTVAAPPSANGQCWNGTAIGSYEKPPSKSSQLQSPIINEQNFTLQVYFDKLKKAHQGEEVELIDDSEEPLAGSGSGSGDGTDGEDQITPDVRVNNSNGDIVPYEGEPAETVPPTTTSKKPEIIQTKGDSSANSNTMSLTRALLQYLIPIILVWFGGTLTDLL